MTRAADALKVFAAVWITGIQSADEPCRHDVVYMTSDSCLLEIHSARFNLTLLPQSWHPPIPPSLPQWAGPRPLPINPAPSYRPLLGAEAGPAVEASPVAIRALAAVNRLEHFRSSVSAIWTTHLLGPPFSDFQTLFRSRKLCQLDQGAGVQNGDTHVVGQKRLSLGVARF